MGKTKIRNQIRRLKHTPHSDRLSRRESGFSLVELLVVLAIIALLGAVVGPQVIKYLAGARSDTTRMQIEDLGAALDLYYLDNGHYPDTQEGLDALVNAPADASRWNGPYLKKKTIPLDGWGNAYRYASPGQNGPYDLYSYGADNNADGEGENADVVSWE